MTDVDLTDVDMRGGRMAGITPIEPVPVGAPLEGLPPLGVDDGRLRASRRVDRVGNRRSALVRRGLLCADVVAITATLLIVSRAGGGLTFRAETLLIVAGILVWILGASLFGLYSRDERRPSAARSKNRVQPAIARCSCSRRGSTS